MPVQEKGTRTSRALPYDIRTHDTLSVSKSVSQSVSESVSQSLSKSVSQSVSKSVPQSVSESSGSILPGLSSETDNRSDLSSANITITIDNNGKAGCSLILFDLQDISNRAPRLYSIESGKSVKDELSVVSKAEYSFHLQGPNGFAR